MGAKLNTFFHSSRPRLVRATLRICGIGKLTPEGTFVQLIRSLDVAKNEAEVDYYVGIMVNSRPIQTAPIALKWHD